MVLQCETSEAIMKEFDAKGHEIALKQLMAMLAGHGPEQQGILLADLVSRWLAGHYPELRKRAMCDWLDMVRELIPVQEKSLLVDRDRNSNNETTQDRLRPMMPPR